MQNTIAETVSPAKCVLSLLPVCQQILGDLNGQATDNWWVWVALVYATTLTNYLHLEILITVTPEMKITEPSLNWYTLGGRHCAKHWRSLLRIVRTGLENRCRVVCAYRGDSLKSHS